MKRIDIDIIIIHSSVKCQKKFKFFFQSFTSLEYQYILLVHLVFNGKKQKNIRIFSAKTNLFKPSRRKKKKKKHFFFHYNWPKAVFYLCFFFCYLRSINDDAMNENFFFAPKIKQVGN